MALSPVTSEADWPDEILAAAKEEFVGIITISKPGTPGKYDPITGDYGPGTAGTVVLGPRMARAQHIRLPIDSNDGNGSQARRRYRFQFEIEPGDASITQGLVVKFESDRDPELGKTTFQVRFAMNSSHAALRTVEAITEGGGRG